MPERIVAVREDILFEKAGITLSAGTLYRVEEVTEKGIILYNDEERIMIDLNTFENGFIAMA